MPEIHGHELSPGDELGTDAVPDCCDDDMTVDGRNFTCGSCWTVLTVNSLGLISDIH